MYKTDPDNIHEVFINENMSVPRHIVCAANKFELPDGTHIVVCGARHHDKIMNRVLDVLELVHPEGKDGEQGFIDQYQQFVSRKDARYIVLKNKQSLRGSTPMLDELYSENLY